MALEGLHHITAITGRRPGERRLLRAPARAAARQEDGEPRRAERLPPLLRRRGRSARLDPHVLRVPRRRARARRRRHGARDPLARRRPPPRSTSGRRGCATASVPAARDGDVLLFRDPEGLAHELLVAGGARRRRSPPTRATSRTSTRCRASTACAPTRRCPERSGELLAALGLPARAGRRRVALAARRRRAARPPLLRPPAAGPRHPGRRDDPPRRLVGRRRRRARGVPRAAPRRPAPRRRRSSTAGTSTPSTSASRAACSSSSPRGTSGFTVDEPVATLGDGAAPAAAARAPARTASSSS